MMPAPYSADLRWRVIWFAMLSRGQLAVRKAVSVGSLSKHDVDGSENVIWKCHFAFLQSFNYSSHYANLWGFCCRRGCEELIVFLQIWKPQFLSVVQFPFDNCHSPFSPTMFFEIGVCECLESQMNFQLDFYSQGQLLTITWLFARNKT